LVSDAKSEVVPFEGPRLASYLVSVTEDEASSPHVGLDFRVHNSRT
jgi:hypothetical protein